MRKLIFLLILTVMASLLMQLSAGATYIKGYFRKDGTYVSPHYRQDSGSSYSTPKSKLYDDYSSSSYKSYTLPDNDVSVKGYYRKDGTYVRPHHRSAPNEYKWDNYGKPSSEQREEFKDLPEIPSYKYDYDQDNVPNRLDRDDDDDFVPDEQEDESEGNWNE